jgi:hypothetical protein
MIMKGARDRNETLYEFKMVCCHQDLLIRYISLPLR